MHNVVRFKESYDDSSFRHDLEISFIINRSLEQTRELLHRQILPGMMYTYYVPVPCDIRAKALAACVLELVMKIAGDVLRIEGDVYDLEDRIRPILGIYRHGYRRISALFPGRELAPPLTTNEIMCYDSMYDRYSFPRIFEAFKKDIERGFLPNRTRQMHGV